MQRLQSRNITLTSEDVSRMNDMADKAAAKGAKNSLFIVRDTAMVVSIKNRTVITAVDSRLDERERLHQHRFGSDHLTHSSGADRKEPRP